MIKKPHLLTVLRRVDLPSLWNVIITVVAGSSLEYSLYLHLKWKQN